MWIMKCFRKKCIDSQFFMSVSVTTLIAAFVWSGSSRAQGEHCASVENDIQRLECFDAAFKAELYETQEPREAVKTLADLVNYNSPDVYFNLSSGEDPCSINSVLKTEKNENTYGGLIQFSYYSFVNLANVERVGKWRSFGYGDHLALILYTDRDTHSGWVSKYRTIKNRDNRTPAESINDFNMKNHENYSGRDSMFFLLVNEYIPDKAQVEAAMLVAIKSCNNR